MTDPTLPNSEAEGAAILRTFRERAAAKFCDYTRAAEEHVRGVEGRTMSTDERATWRARQQAYVVLARLELSAVKIGRDLANYSGPQAQRPRREA